MGRWLDSLRAAEEIWRDSRNQTDKTDKTSPNGVSSVLSVPSGRPSENTKPVEEVLSALSVPLVIPVRKYRLSNRVQISSRTPMRGTADCQLKHSKWADKAKQMLGG
jgi:hypothetical protein